MSASEAVRIRSGLQANFGMHEGMQAAPCGGGAWGSGAPPLGSVLPRAPAGCLDFSVLLDHSLPLLPLSLRMHTGEKSDGTRIRVVPEAVEKPCKAFIVKFCVSPYGSVPRPMTEFVRERRRTDEVAGAIEGDASSSKPVRQAGLEEFGSG